MLKSKSVQDALKKMSMEDALSFTIGQLEFLDPIIHDPLHAEQYAKYLPVKTDGGWVRSTSFRATRYSSGKQNLEGSKSNNIRRIGVDAKKVSTPVWTYKGEYSFGLDEIQLASKSGFNLDDEGAMGIRLDFEKMADRIAAGGFADENIPGLLGGRDDMSSYTDTVEDGAGGDPEWSTKTPAEILNDLKIAVDKVRKQSGYSYWPNLILVDEANYSLISSEKISDLGYRSILDYFLENNAARKNGVNLQVYPWKWCSTQNVDGEAVGGGTGGTTSVPVNRLVAYVNDPKFIRFHIPVPLYREDVTKLSLEISMPHMGQIGGVEFLYPVVTYLDQI